MVEKDDSGNMQLYETETELVVNQAKVAELKTIFIEKAETGDGAVELTEVFARTGGQFS